LVCKQSWSLYVKKRNEDNLQTYQYIYKKGANVLSITGTVDVDKNNFKLKFEVSNLREDYSYFN